MQASVVAATIAQAGCFRLVGKDTGSAVTIIAHVSAVAITIARTSATVAREGRVTSRGFRHIILRHTWEEGTRWSGQPWPLE